MNKLEMLLDACKNGNIENVHKLLKPTFFSKGVNVNIKDENGNTPLNIATFNGHKEIVELLISKGADVNAADKDGFTPVYLASMKGHKEIAELLIAKGADVNAANKDGSTPLDGASIKGHNEIAELLISKGADVNVASNSGLTPLHCASMKGHYETMVLLISKGADVNAATKDGIRPIDFVKENNKMVSLLRKHAAISKPRAMITQESSTIVLVDSKTLGDAGPGGSSFQKAIQSMNNQNDAEATLCFEEALKKGLDTLRQGYSHMSLGEIYIRANDIDKAMDEFTKVLNFKEAIYESVHNTVQYLGIIYSELGKQEIVNVLEQLKNKTSGKINYSLSGAAVERVRQLAIKNKSRLIEREATSLSPTTEGRTNNWEEKDNRGTRQETYQEAVAFWLARNASRKFDPFILYTFDHEENASNALLHTGVIHLTHDSGKLICTETLTFGYYRRDDSKYEAIICGDDLTHELWLKTKECFLKQGGILNNEQEPVKNNHTVIKNPVADIQQVKFLREDKTSSMGQIAVYRVHSAPDTQSAKAFLEQNPVNQKFLYLVVETPEGNYCRDIAGIYKE